MRFVPRLCSTYFSKLSACAEPIFFLASLLLRVFNPKNVTGCRAFEIVWFVANGSEKVKGKVVRHLQGACCAHFGCSFFQQATCIEGPPAFVPKETCQSALPQTRQVGGWSCTPGRSPGIGLRFFSELRPWQPVITPLKFSAGLSETLFDGFV